MKIKLNKTKRKEISIISQIYKTEYLKPPYNENWTTKKAKEKLKFFKKFYDLYTIFLENKIIGFVCINPTFMCPGEIAFAEEIVIKEDFQRKGVGTLVVKNILDLYKKKGFDRFLAIADAETGLIKKFYKRLSIIPSKKDILLEIKLK